MVNTKHGRFTSAFWRSLGVFLLGIPMAANALEISNGIPETRVGHFQVDVTTGGETIPTNSQPSNTRVTAAHFAANDVVIDDKIVFNYYFSYVDPGINGGGFQLSSLQANGSAPVLDPGVGGYRGSGVVHFR